MPPRKVESTRHKDKRDREDLAVPVVPIYIQEKIHPQAIIEALNNHGGFGRWAFIEVADPWDAQNTIGKAMPSC